MNVFINKIKLIIVHVFIILFISFLFGELCLRIYHFFNPTFIFSHNISYNRFRGKPNTHDFDFKLNSNGFKSKEFTKKNKHIYRIIGIGDSMTYGVVPYKNNFLTILETYLKQDGYNIEVYNMGIPGTGPKEYLALFVNEGLALQPDMLILIFYIGNDFSDCDKRKLIEYSYTGSLINFLIKLKFNYEGIIHFGKANYDDNKPTFSKQAYFKELKDRSFIYHQDNKYFVKLLNCSLQQLSLINNICNNQNIKFVVVIAPDEFQIYSNMQNDVIQAYYPNLDYNSWNETLPNKMLMDGLDKLGIKHIDLYPFFKAKSGEALYKPRDTHWNIAGNQLAANIIHVHILNYIREANIN